MSPRGAERRATGAAGAADLGTEPGERAEVEELRGPWWYPGRRHLSDAQRRDVLQQVFFEGPDFAPFASRFTIMLALAVLIAGFGLISDSGPVVIGAMLISPLTTPLMALCTSLVLGHPRRQLRAFGILAAATLGGIALGALMMWVLPEDGAQALGSQELLARTSPSLMDLMVAIAAGAAGAYVLVRREAIAALPGVAIAVALVPPLTTVGITLEIDRADLADDALLLYLTNLAGIILAGSLTMLAMGVNPADRREGLSRRVKLGLASALGAAVVVALPLAEHTRQEINDSHDREDVQRLAEEWAGGTELTVDAELRDDDRVSVATAGPQRPPAVEPLAEAIAAELEEPVEVGVSWTRRERRVARAEP